jgi:hypothetical protein
MMEQTYDVLFFKITQLLLEKDQQLSTALSTIEHLDFAQIGLPESILDGRERVTMAVTEFETLGSFRTPTEKLDCLLATISILTGKQDGVFLDSDSLIPLLLETLIQSRVPHLVANLTYIKVSFCSSPPFFIMDSLNMSNIELYIRKRHCNRTIWIRTQHIRGRD